MKTVSVIAHTLVGPVLLASVSADTEYEAQEAAEAICSDDDLRMRLWGDGS